MAACEKGRLVIAIQVYNHFGTVYREALPHLLQPNMCLTQRIRHDLQHLEFLVGALHLQGTRQGLQEG